MTRKQIRRQFIDLFIIAIMVLIVGVINCPSCFAPPVNWTGLRINIIINLFFFIGLWKGNELMNHLANRIVSWNKNPALRAFMGIFLMFAYTIPATYGIIELSKWVFDVSMGNSLNTVKYATIITIIITLALNAYGFFKAWRESVRSEERLKAEKVKIKYEALRNQLNPHFLFNSLNVLVGLIGEDKDKAIEYVENLSGTFRYVLGQKEQDVVPLREELEFLATYVSLLKIRFGDSFQFNNRVTAEEEEYVLALSTQLLIENAIKHNQLTEAQPLHIKMYKDNGLLVIENNIQRKRAVSSGNGIGLQNIEERLKISGAQEMQIIETIDKFVVKLPILTNQHVEAQ